MEMSEKVLLENGFEKKLGKDGYFYVNGNVGVVHNDFWLPCNVDTGAPYAGTSYVNTIEELYRLAKEGGKSI